MEKMCQTGNKNHNPFKQLVMRLAYFIESNKLTVEKLLIRLGASSQDQISVHRFAEFMKHKVEKRKEYADLFHFSCLIDVDKDGFVGEQDLNTCLTNLNSMSFFENNSMALTSAQFNSEHKFYPTKEKLNISDGKVVSVVNQIRKALMSKKLSYMKLFKQCDTAGVNMVNLGQFITGVSNIVHIATPLLEKIFNIMDSNKIGMVDFAKFEQVLKAMAPSQVPKQDEMEDSFVW